MIEAAVAWTCHVSPAQDGYGAISADQLASTSAETPSTADMIGHQCDHVNAGMLMSASGIFRRFRLVTRSRERHFSRTQTCRPIVYLLPNGKLSFFLARRHLKP